MRQNKMIMRSLVLLGALFFWGNSFAQISLSVLYRKLKKLAVITYSTQTNFPILKQKRI